MKLIVSGASGLLGTELVNFLQISGFEVKSLVRDRKLQDNNHIFWDPENKKIDAKALQWADAIIHLSGENIADRRWTIEQKRRIYNSRIKSTQTLVFALCQLQHPPKCLIMASAIGFYGNCGFRHCHERTPQGHGFLAALCHQWEAAALPAEAKGIRVVNLRFGIILSPKGGVLGKMVPVFQWGLGGRLGSGKQYMSWITIDDVIRIVLFAIVNENLKGPVNVVSPYPVTNASFTKTLAKILNRPAFFHVPAMVLKLIFGKEMAEEVLLSSTRVEPLRLTHAGYAFLYSDLEVALRHLLKK